ncbi:MAG: FAD-dependent oxidoreductase [Hyphomicrobiaceae bacterium]|nr:FAD-dependent oxidoreductase [Hyphomicrobiaceae bacterium]
MKRTADVGIIGGGIIGSAIGYYLTKMGLKDIVLFEKDYLTSGCTGRCGRLGAFDCNTSYGDDRNADRTAYLRKLVDSPWRKSIAFGTGFEDGAESDISGSFRLRAPRLIEIVCR